MDYEMEAKKLDEIAERQAEKVDAQLGTVYVPIGIDRAGGLDLVHYVEIPPGGPATVRTAGGRSGMPITPAAAAATVKYLDDLQKARPANAGLVALAVARAAEQRRQLGDRPATLPAEMLDALPVDWRGQRIDAPAGGDLKAATLAKLHAAGRFVTDPVARLREDLGAGGRRNDSMIE